MQHASSNSRYKEVKRSQNCISLLWNLLLIWAAPFRGRHSESSAAILTNHMTSLSTSMNLPALVVPCLTVHPPALLCTRLNHLSLFSQTLSPTWAVCVTHSFITPSTLVTLPPPPPVFLLMPLSPTRTFYLVSLRSCKLSHVLEYRNITTNQERCGKQSSAF